VLKKKKMFAILGVMALLLVGIANFSFGDSKYLDKEYRVQKQVIDTFALEVNDSKDNNLKGDDLKPLFMRDIYDKEIAKVDHETRMKVAMAINVLNEEKELAYGDFLPMIFLKGNNKLLIGIKHSDNTITLSEFDISKEKPVKLDKQVKEVKVDKEEK